MNISVEKLLEKIRLGEDTFLELKEVRFAGDNVSAPGRKELADELAALANGRGGMCLLGVSDQREILGIPIERLDLVERRVLEICRDSIQPPLQPIVQRLNLPAADGTQVPILRVELKRSLFVHKSPGGYFYRVGSDKREMTPDYLARLFQQRSQTRIIRFDEQTVPGATLDHLDPNLLKKFASKRIEDDQDRLLQKLAMARLDDTRTLVPTIAGVLMGSPEPREWLPNAYIQAVAYRGTTISPSDNFRYQLDAADLSGPLDQQVLGALAFVRKNMRVGAIKNQGRRDIPDFDLIAVFEALVNAVAHRDYSVYGSKIRLRLFSDRLEIFSPGTIPNTMTVESLPYRQAARNEAISSLLARCPVLSRDPELLAHRSFFMDKRGEGVSLILERSEQLSGRVPIYKLIDESELLLTIYAASEGK
ncbi:MAG: ATP-binding protein [Vulcanimicrobiota bacterium]